MGGVDILTPINCQVRGGPTSVITHLHSDQSSPQGLGHVPSRERANQCTPIFKGSLARSFAFVDLRLHGVHCCFVADCAPHVRPLQRLCHDFSPKMALTKATSIAIWDRNKLVTAIALGVWVTNIAFLIRGNWTCPFRFTYMNHIEFNLRSRFRYLAGELSISTIFDLRVYVIAAPLYMDTRNLRGSQPS